MDNKKQLIIIPPMSEALKKLNEVLEGIAGDENIEISIIDDLKELSQFVASSGQCLILASNAKKCATFLQENRFTIAKLHCKTILFTPKEIPQKTMVKLAKIGLTESILESSPPKTFLYKVKLLLRSIKTTKPQEEAENLVKSLDVAARAQEEVSEKDAKEKVALEENVIELERGTKKKNELQDDDAFDYSNPLKGKIKPQEESIDTHWKSNRKKDAGIEEQFDDEQSKIEADSSSIDMYYRGKQKRADAPIEEELDLPTKASSPLSEEEEKKKRSSYQDVIEEGSMKQKRLDINAEEEEQKEKVELVDLQLESGKKKKNTNDVSSEETIPLFNRDKRKNIEPEAKEKERPEQTVEDLGGHYKGKITKQEELPSDDFVDEKEHSYDNSDLDDEKEPRIDLELAPADKKSKKKDNEAGNLDGDPHEGEVDKIDNNMIGDASTVDKIRTRMEGRSQEEAKKPEEDNGPLDLLPKNKSDKEKEERNSDAPTSLSPEEVAKKREASAALEEDEELELSEKREKISAERESKERSSSPLLPEKELRERAASLREDIEANEYNRTETTDQKEEKTREKKENTKLDLEKSKDKNANSAQVEKIDTFYRGGEAKKKDQSWDNLVDQKTSLELLPGKGKRTDGPGQGKDHQELGEMTIDYRKLKEEFDMIAMGENASDRGAIRTSSYGTLKNDEDDGSFKVVEIDPKSLDFSISIINSIYQKDTKPKQIFEMLAKELLANYHAYSVFYTYKLSDKKFSESYNTFMDISGDKMPNEKKEWWLEKKKDTSLFEHFQELSMTTWRCPEIVQNGTVWEDVELPTWAEMELKTKHVELAFPYFDGIDRMGLAVVFFPEGVDSKKVNAVLTVLEMARTLLLDTIQRYQVQPLKVVEEREEEAPKAEEKKNVLSFFSGLFGKKKAG